MDGSENNFKVTLQSNQILHTIKLVIFSMSFSAFFVIYISLIGADNQKQHWTLRKDAFEIWNGW